MQEKYGRDRHATHGNIIRRMRISCWITKATEIQPEYVILIAFPLQQWLRERASISRFAYIACIVLLFFMALTNANLEITKKVQLYLEFLVLSFQ